jgi:hypothetical protein
MTTGGDGWTGQERAKAEGPLFKHGARVHETVSKVEQAVAETLEAGIASGSCLWENQSNAL